MDNKTEKDRLEIIKKLYDFGFEVGYYNHFEIGWVLRDYARLIKEANKHGIKSPETYYHDGKIKGGLSRGQIIEGQKTIENEVKISSDVINAKFDIKKIKVGFNVYSLEEKPRFCDFPSMIGRNSVAELPKLLDGFRFLRKK